LTEDKELEIRHAAFYTISHIIEYHPVTFQGHEENLLKLLIQADISEPDVALQIQLALSAFHTSFLEFQHIAQFVVPQDQIEAVVKKLLDLLSQFIFLIGSQQMEPNDARGDGICNTLLVWGIEYAAIGSDFGKTWKLYY
jgi:hypothetical protein